MNVCGSQPSHRVWEFRDATRTWIAWGSGYDPPTPAAGSAAALAFSELKVCRELAPQSMLDRAAAIQLAELIRAIRRKEGLQVLAGRTYTGSAPPRPACGCRSLRGLARQLGISRRQAARLAGWDYDGRSGSPDRANCRNFGGFNDSADCPAGITGPQPP